jgi:hypothetical protein
MAQELCQCQLGTHGHEPGKCPEPATEPDNLCKSCHDKAEVADVAPFSGAAVGDALFGGRPTLGCCAAQ